MENFWLIFNFNYHFIVPKYILLIIVDIRKLIIKNVINLVFYFPRIWSNTTFFFFYPCVGIGYAVVLIAFYVDFYYNVIIAWALRYFFASFASLLPWTTCDNPWNTLHCRTFDTNISYMFDDSYFVDTYPGNSSLVEDRLDRNSNQGYNSTWYTSAAQEYFKWA